MEQAIAELEGQLEAEPPTSEIDGGEIFAEFPFAESLNPDAITVIANYEDGSSEVIDDEYISVESASVLGGDQVVVDGLEIPSDRAVADLEVKGVSTGRTRHLARFGDEPGVPRDDPRTGRNRHEHTPAGRR